MQVFQIKLKYHCSKPIKLQIIFYLFSLFYPQNISVIPVRLRGSHSPNMGRIEVHCAGTWGSVQASGWDIKDATVACRQLGYHSASLPCKPSREVSIKRVGEEGTLGSFLPSPFPSVFCLSPPFPVSLSPLPPFCVCLVAQSLYGAFFRTFLVNAFRRPRDKSTYLVGYPHMSSDPTLSLTLYNRLI